MSTPNRTDDAQDTNLSAGEGGAGGSNSPGEPGGQEPEGPTAPQKRAVKLGLILTLLLAGAVLTSLLPLPFVIVSGALALAAIVCAVMSIVAGVRAGQAPQALVTGIIGLLIAGYVLISAVATAAIWPIRQEFEECIAHAITEQAQATCQSEYGTGVADWFESVTGQPLPASLS
ncbi:hypothetical protein [Brevibacterium album]|uniref:hypothetical protein n=1 Tax=Brevibacterium album TaxID=417948 RepID=UPI0004106DE0|nr:hypothetical protein [Brevibacterium album]